MPPAPRRYVSVLQRSCSAPWFGGRQIGAVSRQFADSRVCFWRDQFLTENGYEHPISPKILSSPSDQDVFRIFQVSLAAGIGAAWHRYYRRSTAAECWPLSACGSCFCTRAAKNASLGIKNGKLTLLSHSNGTSCCAALPCSFCTTRLTRISSLHPYRQGAASLWEVRALVLCSRTPQEQECMHVHSTQAPTVLPLRPLGVAYL